jgi:transcriptional regulator
MYVPGHFADDSVAFCHGVIEAAPFAPIITQLPDRPLLVSHLPFLLDADRGRLGTLIGHVARANEHADALAGLRSLVMFSGPHAYISPTWYETHPAVPTWNYVVVHATGTAVLLDDARTRAYLRRLAMRFEGPDGWRFEAQPDEYQSKMVNGILAFELPIDELRGKAKLSQNRSAQDRARVTAALQASTVPAEIELGRVMAARS